MILGFASGPKPDNAAIFENVVFRYSISGESVFWKRPQSFPEHKK